MGKSSAVGWSLTTRVRGIHAWLCRLGLHAWVHHVERWRFEPGEPEQGDSWHECAICGERRRR